MSQAQINSLFEELRIIRGLLEQLALQQQAQPKLEMTRDEAWTTLMGELDRGANSKNWYTLEECFGDTGV